MPAFMLPSPLACGAGRLEAFLAAGGVLRDHCFRGDGRPHRPASSRELAGTAVRTVALDTAIAVPLHAAAADSSHRRDHAADYPVGRAGHASGHAHHLYHLSRADHRQHDAGTDQRGRELYSPLSDAQRHARQMLFKLRLPNAVPSLFVGIRISAGIAVIGAITGELFAGSNSVGQGGLGYSIIFASQQLQTDYLFALIVASAVLGFAFYFIVYFLEWYFLHDWHESARVPEVE